MQRKRDEELITKAQWEQQTNNLARITELKEREIERQQKYLRLKTYYVVMCFKHFHYFRALQQQLQTENCHIASEQKCYQDYMDNVVFTNRPTTEYFNQFNTSSR